jgi:hypothetical protein
MLQYLYFLKLQALSTQFSNHHKSRNTLELKKCHPLGLQTLLYGSENWSVKVKGKTRIRAAEMKFMRSAVKLNLDGLRKKRKHL